MPAKKGKQPDEKFLLRLTSKQRESVVNATRLTLRLKTRIEEAAAERHFVEFTKKELVKMGEEIYTYLAFAPPAHTKRLKTVLGRIADLVDDLEEKLEWIAS